MITWAFVIATIYGGAILIPGYPSYSQCRTAQEMLATSNGLVISKCFEMPQK